VLAAFAFGAIAAELSGRHVKLVKSKGEFIFHHHENEDEMFLVVKGRFRMEFRDRQVCPEESEFIVVPRGVEHRPVPSAKSASNPSSAPLMTNPATRADDQERIKEGKT